MTEGLATEGLADGSGSSPPGRGPRHGGGARVRGAWEGFPASDPPSHTGIIGEGRCGRKAAAVAFTVPLAAAAPLGDWPLSALRAALERRRYAFDRAATMPLQQRPDADPAPTMQSESGHSGSSRLRFVALSPSIAVVFGAAEYFVPIRLRLFQVEGCRFEGVAYRIAPAPSGGESWTPDAFDEADLLQAAEHIPSIRAVRAGWPTILEVGDDGPDGADGEGEPAEALRGSVEAARGRPPALGRP